MPVKFIYIVMFTLVVLGMMVAPVFADAQAKDKPTTGLNKIGEKSFGLLADKKDGTVVSTSLVETAGKYLGVLLSLTGVIALGYVMYGSYEWITAGGSIEKVNSARKIITNSLIAVVIIGSAYTITAYLVSVYTASLVG